MRSVSSAALGGALLLGLVGFGIAGCTTIAEPAAAPCAGTVAVPPAPGHAATAVAPYGADRVPDYVAAARAGDTSCQEATVAVRDSAYDAGSAGSVRPLACPASVMAGSSPAMTAKALTALISRIPYEAAVTGSPAATARAERSRGFAHRDC